MSVILIATQVRANTRKVTSKESPAAHSCARLKRIIILDFALKLGDGFNTIARMPGKYTIVFLLFAGILLAVAPAHGQQLQTFKDCVVGKRVSTNDGRKGVITRLDTAWSYCYVRFDDNGKESSFLYSLLNAAGGTGQAPAGRGQQLQSFKDCVVGKRVSTNDGRKGVITRLNPAWSYCFVRFDDNGKETSFLYSLLNSEDNTATSGNLTVGTYECVTGGRSTTMLLRITGPNTYSVSGSSGKVHMEPSGKIVFETGPMKEFSSKLLSGGRIGLNLNGGAFYGTSCELNRNLH
jgi:hypothetical protein